MSETDKKQRLLRAAEQLFHSRQFHEITLDEVARRADVGKGTIYLYFSDKHDLFYQTGLAGFEEMCALLRENAARGLSFREELAQAARSVGEFFRLRRPIFQMIRTEGKGSEAGAHRGEMFQRRRRVAELLSEIVGRGKAAGEIRSGLPNLVLAEYLLGMLRARAMDGEGTEGKRGEDVALVDFFLYGAAGSDRTGGNGSGSRGKVRAGTAPAARR